MRAAVAAAAACVACAGSGPAAHVRIVRAHLPDLTFDLPLETRPCRGGGVLLTAAEGGNGILVWLRGADPLAAGSVPLLTRADTTGPRGATASVRYMAGDLARGTMLDSGVVRLGAGGAELDGSGIESGSVVRATVYARLSGIRLARDTTPCEPAP